MTQQQPTREQAVRLLSFLPSRPDYDTWVKVISAVGNTFGEYEALSILHSRWSDEKPNETAYKLTKRIPDMSFGYVVNLAKRYGWQPDYSQPDYQHRTADNRMQVGGNVIVSKQPIQTTQAIGIEDFIIDEFCEEPIYNADGDRLFRVAFNREMVNKTKLFTKRFFNYAVSWDTFVKLVTQDGISFAPSQFVNTKGEYKIGNDDGSSFGFFYIVKRNDTWYGSEMLVLDFDKGMTIDEFKNTDFYDDCALAYTSPSHTAERHKFRAIWLLPYFITHKKAYQAMVQTLIDYYKSDPVCKDWARFYFGNSNAIIIGEDMQ
jgi:hypothetical protein